MRLKTEVDVIAVYTTDFDTLLPVPAAIEGQESISAIEGGVKLTFSGIDSLMNYTELLKEEDSVEAEQKDSAKDKVKKELKRAIREYHSVLESTRAYAKRLFDFIYDTDAHREDKRNILNELIENIIPSENDAELEQAIQDATYELGPLPLDYKSTFRNYSRNYEEFDFLQIRDLLVKELNALKATLVF